MNHDIFADKDSETELSDHLIVQPAKKFKGTVNSLFPLHNMCTYVHTYVYVLGCTFNAWLWENPPVTHKDNYLEKHN